MACDAYPAKNQVGLVYVHHHGPLADLLGQVSECVEGIARNGELDLAHTRPVDGGWAEAAIVGSTPDHPRSRCLGGASAGRVLAGPSTTTRMIEAYIKAHPPAESARMAATGQHPTNYLATTCHIQI